MPKYTPRRGREAVEQAANTGGGGFKPFVPEIQWREDGTKKYVLILTDADEIASLDLHEWVPVGKGEKANGETYTRYEAFLSRKDPVLGEDYDHLSDGLGRKAKTRCYGVAVELEPVMETVRGRQRPKGFSVKTETFTRKSDDGEVEVTAPVIGLIVQSSSLMWTPLMSYDESQGPLLYLPLEIIRRGVKTNTRYDFVPFVDAPVDFTPLISNVDGISYLKDVAEVVEAAIAAAEDDAQAAQAIASALYDKRLEELADMGRYEELTAGLTAEDVADKYDKSKKASPSARPARPSRPSPRKAEEEAPAEEAPVSSKEDRFAALKAKVESK